jgi:uncharacterized protein
MSELRDRYCGHVLGPGWTEVVALAAAYVIAALATPAGVSGAVLLLPFQVSVLGTPSPAVTPTNLLYNIVSTPGALYRYWRQGQTGGRLAGALIGTMPGVIAGSVIRVELLPGPRVFDLVVACVLIPLGTWLALTRPPRSAEPSSPRLLPAPALVVLAAAVGCVGGIYGIGGGSILAPVLIGSGREPAEVAPAALASTFVTSVAGVITFMILSAHQHGSVAPDWPIGIALGAGGLAGAYTGARIQSRLPDVFIRRLISIVVITIGARYLWSGLGCPGRPAPGFLPRTLSKVAAQPLSPLSHFPPGSRNFPSCTGPGAGNALSRRRASRAPAGRAALREPVPRATRTPSSQRRPSSQGRSRRRTCCGGNRTTMHTAHAGRVLRLL